MTNEPPAHLSQRAKEIYRELAPKRAKSPERKILFVQALEEYDRIQEAKAILRGEGLTFTSKKTGTVHQHPAVKMEREARNAFARLWRVLGLQWRFAIDSKVEDDYED